MKTNTLFVAFVVVLPSVCFLQIYLTNSQIISANEIIYPNGCKHCPVYKNNNAALNIRVHHMGEFHNCSDLQLPITHQSPGECLPRLIILPSHATSGSKLFQNIWEIFGSSMSQYYEPPRKIHKMFTFGALDIYGTSNHSIGMQQPIIFKSHISQSRKPLRRQEMIELLHKAKDTGALRGIIRMARNPGDQLIRNAFRWGLSYKYCKGHRSHFKSDFDCFLKKSVKLCDRLVRGSAHSRTRDRHRAASDGKDANCTFLIYIITFVYLIIWPLDVLRKHVQYIS